MRVLVLGSSGFVGAWVVRELKRLRSGAEVIESSLSGGTDLRERQQVRALFRKSAPTHVINCAAYVGGVQFGHVYPADMYYNNMEMILNIFDACREHGVRRLVQPVSNCAYPVGESFFREDRFWSGPLDDSVLAYGMTRKMMWVGAWAYRTQYGLDTVSLVLSNMYGPGDHFDEMRSHALGALVKKIIDAKRDGKSEVVIWGTGDPIREWLYVEDGAEALVRSLDIKPYGDIINIGTGQGISVTDLATMIKEIGGWEGRFVYDTSKVDGAPCKIVDGAKGREILGWKPRVGLRDGMRRTIDYYLENVCALSGQAAKR